MLPGGPASLPLPPSSSSSPPHPGRSREAAPAPANAPILLRASRRRIGRRYHRATWRVRGTAENVLSPCGAAQFRSERRRPVQAALRRDRVGGERRRIACPTEGLSMGCLLAGVASWLAGHFALAWTPLDVREQFALLHLDPHTSARGIDGVPGSLERGLGLLPDLGHLLGGRLAKAIERGLRLRPRTFEVGQPAVDLAPGLASQLVGVLLDSGPELLRLPLQLGEAPFGPGDEVAVPRLVDDLASGCRVISIRSASAARSQCERERGEERHGTVSHGSASVSLSSPSRRHARARPTAAAACPGPLWPTATMGRNASCERRHPAWIMGHGHLARRAAQVATRAVRLVNPLSRVRCHSQAVRQRSAKPPSPVQIRVAPPGSTPPKGGVFRFRVVTSMGLAGCRHPSSTPFPPVTTSNTRATAALFSASSTWL